MSYLKVSGIHGRPGYAEIRIGYALGSTPFRVTIQKALQEGPYLGLDGTWQPSPALFTPLDIKAEGTSTVIQIGPEIVDRIVEDERIRIGIPTIEFHGEVIWSNIAPSSGRIGQSVFQSRTAPAPAAAPAEPAMVPQLFVPEREPRVADNPALATPFKLLSRRGLLLCGFALLLLVAASIAFADWQYKADPANSLVARLGLMRPATPDRQATAGPAGAAPATTPTAPPTTRPADPQRALGELREMITRNGDLARILEAGQRLMASDRPDLREEGFRAIDVAATRGLAAAQLAMGKLHDPRYWREGSPLPHASASVAASYYARAARGGATDARPELTGVCDRLRSGIEVMDAESRAQAVAQFCN